jgi:ribonuclease-3
VTAQDEAIERVAAALGHQFRDPALLRTALTHRSYANERRREGVEDNERLEFLGDAVLGWVVSTLLWEHFPGASAGEMTRRRADLVCETALHQIAQQLGIGEALRLGRGEARSGGRNKPRLLASAFEACIAAVYLDGDSAAAAAVARRLLTPQLAATSPGASDFKTRVQELVQQSGAPPPRYELLETSGPDHAREFRVALRVNGHCLGEGLGRSKLEAEQAAAARAYQALVEAHKAPRH